MATPESTNSQTAGRKVGVRFAGNEIVYIDESIANSGDDDAILAAARAARREQNLPLSLQPTTVARRQPTAGDYAMEAIAAVNRPSANLLDVLTSPIQYPIAAIQQGSLVPRGEGFFSSRVGERGQFAGDGAISQIIQAAGELGSMSLPMGFATRATSNILAKASQFDQSVLQRVLAEMGRTTPMQDFAYGAASGAGGEAAVQLVNATGFGNEEIARFGGQLLAPAALNGLANSLVGLSKQYFRAAPDVNTLYGTKTALYKVLDESGIKLDGPSIRPFMGAVDDLVNRYTLDGAGNSGPTTILKNLRKAAEDGELTYARLENDIRVLRGENSSIADQIAKELDDQLMNIVPLNPGVLNGKTFGEALAAAKEMHRRASNARSFQRTLQNVDKDEIAGKNYVETLKNALLPFVKEGTLENRFIKPSEAKIIEDAISGKGLSKILYAAAEVGFNSGDLLRSVMYGAIFGSAGASAGYAASGISGVGAGIVAGTVLASGLRSYATNVVKKNASLMQHMLRAGPDGEQILQGYLRYTPREQRDARELAGLFVNQRVDLRYVQEYADRNQSSFLKDSVALAIGLQEAIDEAQRRSDVPLMAGGFNTQ